MTIFLNTARANLSSCGVYATKDWSISFGGYVAPISEKISQTRDFLETS